MKVNKELIEKLAHLSKLEFDEASKEELIQDLNNVLTFMEKLNELDTSGVQPLTYVTETTNSLRKDVVKQEITPEEALRNAPATDGIFFKVPKVIQRP